MPDNEPVYDDRVAVLVDVQNMFYSAKYLKQSKVDYGKLLTGILDGRSLVRAIAYIVQKPDVDQSGFHDALSRIGFDLRVKEMKIHPQVGDKKSVAKGSHDITITCDALMLAPKVDTIVLVTGDGDFAILADRLKALGCRVEVVSFDGSTAGDLIHAADEFIPINDEWIFKEKKFEQQATAVAVAAPSYEGLPADDDESIGNK